MTERATKPAHRRPGARTAALARAMTFPRGALAVEWQQALEASLRPHLERLQGSIAAIRRILDLVAPVPADYPCSVLHAAEGSWNVDELGRFVPGNVLEVPAFAAEAFVFTYRYPGHGRCHPEAIEELERGLATLEEDLLQPDPDLDRKLVEALKPLPASALDLLEARQEPWNEPLAEREAWMRRTIEALDRLAPEDEPPQEDV